MEISKILAKCDHTLLTQTASWADIKKICDDGMKYKTASVCIPPYFVKQAKEYVGENLAICTVIGFPNGYNTTAVKVFETKDAIANGADEIDMVINIGALKAGMDDFIVDEIKQIKAACGDKDNRNCSKHYKQNLADKKYTLLIDNLFFHSLFFHVLRSPFFNNKLNSDTDPKQAQ